MRQSHSFPPSRLSADGSERKSLWEKVRAEGFEPPTFASGGPSSPKSAECCRVFRAFSGAASSAPECVGWTRLTQFFTQPKASLFLPTRAYVNAGKQAAPVV
jgi:hypothetical protein